MSILHRARRFFSGPNKNASRERRKLKRMACHQAFLCTKGEVSFPLTVIDVGFGGFKVMSEHPIGKRGDLLHLRRVATDFKRHLTGAYTTGLMVRVAWAKESDGHFEAGLHLPEAPGSMRISWFRELLSEMGFDEKAVFTQRHNRRHRCRLPSEFSVQGRPVQGGLLLDLSSGGGMFGAAKAANMGDQGRLSARWGSKELLLDVTVVGLRANNIDEAGPRWLHSVKFEENFGKAQESILYAWLEELARNE